MGKSNIENMSQEEYKEEITTLKKKIKRIRIIILSIILLVVVLFIGNFTYTYNIYKKMLEHNVEYEINDNYKRTVINKGKVTTYYYKDGKYKMSNDFNNVVMWKDKDESYFINNETKTYFKDVGVMKKDITEYSKLYNLNYFMMLREDINFKNVALMVLLERPKVKREEYNNVKYIVLSEDAYKYWINPETFFVEREGCDGDITETKIEKGVVTDRDVEKPNLTGYTFIENK